MKQKLEENELDNVNGGACDAQHQLLPYKVKVTYLNTSGKQKEQGLVVYAYNDTLKDKDGNTIEQALINWCNGYGYTYISWKNA